eukprot:774795-Pleurochrysis_carterae.AAC.2
MELDSRQLSYAHFEMADEDSGRLCHESVSFVVGVVTSCHTCCRAHSSCFCGAHVEAVLNRRRWRRNEVVVALCWQRDFRLLPRSPPSVLFAGCASSASAPCVCILSGLILSFLSDVRVPVHDRH